MISAPEVRERLGVPVIDSDAHVIEYLPLVRDLVAEEGDEELATRFDLALSGPDAMNRLPPAARRKLNSMRPPWWGLAASSLDRATAMLPNLLRSRLEDLGFDFMFLYPTFGMAALHLPDAELRAVGARAFNRYSAEVFADVRDRIEPVAAIPAFTPDEALAAITHAVDELGLKSVVLTGLVPRLESRAGTPLVYDGLGYDAPHDYDPVWRACVERDLVPTFHTPGFGHGTRSSAGNYMFNHLGGFAAGADGAARSLLFGGVPRRFPTLRFGFMEGGAAWAVALCSDLIAHWQKRGAPAIGRLDPARVDRARIAELFREHGSADLQARADRLDAALAALSQPVTNGNLLDEFADAGFDGPETIAAVFRDQIFAGCEADDPLTSLAFDGRFGPGVGVLLGSDLGHWDAPDATEILPEAWEQVERGLLTEAQLRRLTFDDPVRAWAGTGLGPFRGTALEDAVVAATGAVSRSGSPA